MRSLKKIFFLEKKFFCSNRMDSTFNCQVNSAVADSFTCRCYKNKCVGRKMRRRCENFEIQELRRSFLVLKTRKIYQNTVKNSSKIAPKARKILGVPSHLTGDSLKWLPALRICRFSLKWSDHLGENLL